MFLTFNFARTPLITACGYIYYYYYLNNIDGNGNSRSVTSGTNAHIIRQIVGLGGGNILIK